MMPAQLNCSMCGASVYFATDETYNPLVLAENVRKHRTICPGPRNVPSREEMDELCYAGPEPGDD